MYRDPRRFSVEPAGSIYVSIYCPQDNTETFVLVADTLTALHAPGLPFVLIGDFNVPAADMTHWLQQQGMDSDFHVVSPGPTCLQNPSAPTAIDYAIVPTKLLAALGDARVVRTSLDVHDCVSLKLGYGEGQECTATMWHCPKREDPQHTHRPLFRSGMADGWLADARQLLPSLPAAMHVTPSPVVAWERLADQWLQWAREDLAANLGQEVSPAVGKEFSFTHVNALQCLHMHTKPSDRVDLHLRKVIREIRSLKGVATKARIPPVLLASTALRLRDLAVPHAWDTPWGIADDLFALQHVSRELQEAQLQSWAAYLAHELDTRIRLLKQASRLQWKQRIQHSADKRQRLAFHLIKKEPPAPLAMATLPNGDRTPAIGTVVQQYAEVWTKWWHGTAAPSGQLDALQAALGHVEAPAPLSGEQLRAAALTFPKTTSLVDGLHPRALAALSPACLDALGLLLHYWTLCGWPSKEAQLVVVLIPKKDRGLRPIALFRSLYRLYSRARSSLAAAWAAAHSEGSLCSNASGRWVGDSTWRHQIRAVMRGAPSHRLDIMLDLQKAFEHVPHAHLIQAGRMASYPMHLLASSLIAHLWPRWLQYKNAVSEPIFPSRGTAAGSTTATYELWLSLRPCLLRLAAVSPNVQPALCVDDLSLHVQHENEDEALALAMLAADVARQAIQQELGMQFAGDKGCVVASTSSLARLAARHIFLEAQAADTVRRLGVD
jgi:hypothetical protein